MFREVGEGLVQLRLQLALVALAELLAAHFLHGAEEAHRVLAKLGVAALQVSRGDVRFVPPTDLEGTGYDMCEVTRYMFRKACLAQTRRFPSPPAVPSPCSYCTDLWLLPQQSGCWLLLSPEQKINSIISENNIRQMKISPSVDGNRPAALILGEAVPLLDRSLYKPGGRQIQTHHISHNLLPVARPKSNSFILYIKEAAGP